MRGEQGYLAYLLRQAQAATRLTLERSLAGLGVTPPQFVVLTMLRALSAEHMVRNADKLEKKVYGVPEEIDKGIAALKLQTMGVQSVTATDTTNPGLTVSRSGITVSAGPARTIVHLGFRP